MNDSIIDYKEIKKDFLKFPIELNEDLFKKSMIASLEDSEEILILTNRLDIQNNNGDLVNTKDLIDVINRSESKERLMNDRGIYATEIDGNPARVLALALAFVLSGDAVIMSCDVRNYGTVNLMAVLINTVLEELYGITHMVTIYNAPPSELKEELRGTDAIMFCI